MIELLTGTPGSCKTATAVADICVSVPGSFIEAQERCVSHGVTYEKGERVPRHLFSNINGLLVEHQYIDDESMRTWHEWAQPGDVIVFDEAQSLWRQRAIGSKVPEEVQALETHRHKGVDLVVVTQHPMLLDSNVRRLVNRHRHLRKLPGGWVYEYEWDHCGQPGSYRSCIRSGARRIPKKAFPLYKSAQLHTKSTVRPPLMLILAGLGALGVAGYAGPDVYQRIAHRAEASKGQQVAQGSSAGGLAARQAGAAASAARVAASAPAVAASAAASAPVSSGPVLAGCVAVGARCGCFDVAGERVEVEASVCLDRLPRGGQPREFGHVPAVGQEAAGVVRSAADSDVWAFMRGQEAARSPAAGYPLRLTGETVGTWR